MRAVEQGELIADRYLVQGFLGMGIVSVVYLAIDINEARPVAVKMLRSRFLEMPGLSAPGSMYPMASLLRREIQVHAGLKHQHIVELLDHGTWEDTPYAVLEYVEDPSVESQFEHPVSPIEAIEITTQVLDALTYLHEQGVIHRDLKPDHIHFSAERGVKLLDLGLAMDVDDTDSTSIVSIMGSKRYGAPEQHRVQGRQVNSTVRSDVFSAAAVLERLLLGTEQRLGDSSPEASAVPAPLAELIERAMSEDPSNRPADAREFASLLQASVGQ